MTTETKAAVSLLTLLYPVPVHLTAAKDDSRPALECVVIEGDHTGVKMVSADGMRMTVYTNELTCEDEFRRMVPANFLLDLWRQRKTKGRGDVPRELHIMSDGGVGYVDAKTGAMRTCSCPENVTFPKYEKILHDVIEDVTTNLKDTFELREIGFNSKFLGSIPQVFETCDTMVRWLPPSTSKHPSLFLGVPDDGGKLMHVLMPMWIKDSETDLDTLPDWVDTRLAKLRLENKQLMSERANLAKANEVLTAELEAKSSKSPSGIDPQGVEAPKPS